MTGKTYRNTAGIGPAFLLLLAVSVYRQISLHRFPGDPARPAVVYAVYALLLAAWWGSIRGRGMQENMRRFLLAEHAVMLLWATVRFAQEALLLRELYLMRVSGYLVSIPMALLPLLGLYAAFGLGKPAGYRPDRRWYALLLPALALILLTLTNEGHHLVFRTLPGEPPVNLSFHPGPGLWALVLWALSLELARAALICRRSRTLEGRRKAVPFLICLSMLVFTLPYLALSFAVELELIEYSALMLFLEVLVWESCIRLGLVLVNSRYPAVFDRSTAAMQILRPDGSPYLRSARAAPLSPRDFRILKEQGVLATPEGLELHLKPIRGGYVLWQEDVSPLLAAVEGLRESAAQLEQEGALLRQEWRARAQEAAVRERSRLYDQLTAEVGGRLSLLEELLDRAESAQRPEAALRAVCLVGTYIKRRCALRLLDAPGGQVPGAELALCLRELTDCLLPLGVRARFRSEGPPPPVSHAFALFALDAGETLLERTGFAPRSLEAVLAPGPRFTLSLTVPSPPEEPPPWVCPPGLSLHWQVSGENCRLTLTEGGDRP